jgi:hypothetical protein
MRKTLAAVVTALSLLTFSPAAAQASGGGGPSTSSAWPVATSPLPAGTILSQSGNKAVVLSPKTVAATETALDAAYVKAGYTVGVSAGIPRWYRGHNRQINVFFAALDGGRSQWTLNAA